MTAWLVPFLLAFCALLWPSGDTGLGPLGLFGSGDSAATGSAVRASMAGAVARLLPTRQLDASDVLSLVDAIGPALESGLAPSAALAAVAQARLRGGRAADEVTDLAQRMSEIAVEGRALGPHWREAAVATGSAELRLLGQAWSLTEELGAPLADAVRTTAGLLRARISQERRLTSATAGARATIQVLTMLPLGGPALAFLLGISPADLYGSSPLTVLCLVMGAVLVVVGRWWVRRMVSRVARGTGDRVRGGGRR